MDNYRLCQFKNLFGEPRKGVHSVRLFNIAIIDVILTLIGAKLLQWTINILFAIDFKYWYYLLFLFVLGILLHRLFCVETTIDKLLFN